MPGKKQVAEQEAASLKELVAAAAAGVPLRFNATGGLANGQPAATTPPFTTTGTPPTPDTMLQVAEVPRCAGVCKLGLLGPHELRVFLDLAHTIRARCETPIQWAGYGEGDIRTRAFGFAPGWSPARLEAHGVELHAYDKKGHAAIADDKAANSAASTIFENWSAESV